MTHAPSPQAPSPPGTQPDPRAPIGTPPRELPREPETWHPVAAVLAIVFPGAGHAYLGERRRAAMIAVSVLGLFFGGIFLGGIDSVDRQEDGVWFLGQAMVGPIAFGVDSLHQNRFKALDPAEADRAGTLQEFARLRRRSAMPGETRRVESFQLIDRANGAARVSVEAPVFRPSEPGAGPPNVKSIGRVNELGTLYSTIAGMLNLIVIIDAAYRAAPARVRGVRGGAFGRAEDRGASS